MFSKVCSVCRYARGPWMGLVTLVILLPVECYWHEFRVALLWNKSGCLADWSKCVSLRKNKPFVLASTACGVSQPPTPQNTPYLAEKNVSCSLGPVLPQKPCIEDLAKDQVELLPGLQGGADLGAKPSSFCYNRHGHKGVLFF